MSISKILMTDTTFQLKDGRVKRVVKRNKNDIPEYKLFISDEDGTALEYLYKHGEDYTSVKACDYDEENHISKSKVIIINNNENISADVQFYVNTKKIVVTELDNITKIITIFTYDPKNKICTINNNHNQDVFISCNLDVTGSVTEIVCVNYHYQKLFTDAFTCCGIIDVRNDVIVHTKEFDEIEELIKKYLNRYRGD